MARMTLGAERFGTEATLEEYRGLELGEILYFPASPPLLPDEDRTFLVTQKQVDASYHKNISYRPMEDRLKGVDQDDAAQRARVHEIMRVFPARDRLHVDLLEAVCGKLEHRLRQFPADRGIGASGGPSFAERSFAF